MVFPSLSSVVHLVHDPAVDKAAGRQKDDWNGVVQFHDVSFRYPGADDAPAELGIELAGQPVGCDDLASSHYYDSAVRPPFCATTVAATPSDEGCEFSAYARIPPQVNPDEQLSRRDLLNGLSGRGDGV